MFIINLVPLHVFTLLLMGRFSFRLVRVGSGKWTSIRVEGMLGDKCASVRIEGLCVWWCVCFYLSCGMG